MIRRLFIAALLLTVIPARLDAADPTPEAKATIVVYNKNDKASLALAKYYAGKRDIPADQLIGLDCLPDEEISRDHYLVKIAAPLRNTFTQRGWWKIVRNSDGNRVVESATIRFAALIRGVPMKIRQDPAMAPVADTSGLPPGSPADILRRQNEASVDSELAAMFALSDQAPSVIGNPYYRRFMRAMDVPPSSCPLLVCRLDGPSDAVVRRMIDDAIATEKTGLWGWAYLDARNITTGGYAEGDAWLTRVGEMMRRRGIPVISDYAPEVLPAGYPVTNAAIYYGWYSGTIEGPFAKPDFKFVPGAIAAHIHSFSAMTIRDPKVAWTGPLAFHGATATMGNVYEPYLSLTINFDLLQDRLMNGFTLAEASYAATMGLSWMSVVLGDPLYRPYTNWNTLGSEEDLSNPWQRYRSIILKADGDVLAAADALRAFAKESGNSMPLEALGQAQGAAQQTDTALQTLDEAAKIEKSPKIRFRLVLEQIELLRRANRSDDALKKISDALGTFRTDEQQSTLGNIVLILRPPPRPEKEKR